MTEQLNCIITDIEEKVKHIYMFKPICIYIVIGSYAGSIKIDQNKIPFIDDKDNQQFPPVLQKLYLDFPDMQFFCIYIDPVLENPIFITQDFNLRQKLFENNIWKKNDDEFCYENKRITVYPFRHSIKIKNTLREITYNFLDITDCINRLHEICKKENIFYQFADFTGIDYCKYIESYFMDSIKINLDSIAYGLGNGFISGCFYDLTSPEAHFAYIREKNEKRDMIRIFNITHIINMYNTFTNKEKEKITFTNFLNNVIDIFPIENIDIIMSQLKIYIDNFISIFKNFILSNLRYLYNIQNNIYAGKDINFNINYDGLNILGIDIINKISKMIDQRDCNMFEKIKELIGNKYKIEFELLLYEKYQMNSIELINYITQSDDVYQWHNVCSNMLN